jgi:hypothetical protein
MGKIPIVSSQLKTNYVLMHNRNIRGQYGFCMFCMPALFIDSVVNIYAYCDEIH